MNYNEFIKAYEGKATDYDGAYGAQCVDLIKLYLDKVFDIKPGSWGNAKYYWIDFEKHPELTTNFTKIKNTLTFVPKKGDIMVWQGGINGGYGHLAICTGDGNINHFYSHDQNWSGKVCKKIKHDYKKVYGVLRPKDQRKINPVQYFKRYYGKTNSIVDALKAVGASYSFSYRGKIAKANGIAGYIGTPAQNTKMLDLLKKGKLIKP